MKLHVAGLPEDPAALPGWLEGHLVGLDLAALVAELEAIRGTPADGPALREVLGSQFDAVLTAGLDGLPAEALRRLLVRPRLLLDLQELVLGSGSDYWDRVARPAAEHAAEVDRVRARLEASLMPEGRATAPGGPAGPRRPAWGRRPWLVGLAAAAALLLAFLASQPRQSARGWGWDRPDALPRSGPPDAYLNGLADAAGEWFNKVPEDRSALADRILDLRRGCSVLLRAEHRPLSGPDRAWLLGRCRAWASELDGLLAEAEAQDEPRGPSELRRGRPPRRADPG
ncbi:MAG: hypothetical protein WKF75_00070 [Singulisphaera sp.]